MKHQLKILLVGLIVIIQFSYAQKGRPLRVTKTEKQLMTNLKAHIQYLADDRLEGRRAGTTGEKLAREYIIAAFQTLGLQPKGTQGYEQPFEIYDGKQINPSTHFMINNNYLTTGADFFPLAFSGSASLEALSSVAVQEEDMPWFFDLKTVLEENNNNPHFELYEYIRINSKKAKDRGASAVILYNTSAIDDRLQFEPRDRSEILSLPVVYVTKEAAQKYFSDSTATLDIKLKIDIGDKKRTGYNVIGYLDNGAPFTVVLGAHYDHLGYGEDGNSMLRTGEQLIHNGADDNASGTAALLELARLLKTSKQKNSNYLFIAFSGEELGLYGSKYFADNPTINLSSVNCMINMDMIGRLNDSSRILTVGGVGTSPQWSSLVRVNNKKSSFVIRVDSSGTGPSDHTSFYKKEIPVLFFFTGLHADYHKPGDDADKINYAGEAKIISYISSIVQSSEITENKLAFSKTRESQSATSIRSGGVTMGIMPDYTFSGTGVKLDGVSEGKTAQKAGLKAGDIILQLGEYPVNSVENYMQVLGKFKKGDEVQVTFRRGQEIAETIIRF